MAEETQNNPKKDETFEGLRHPAEFEKFVEWVSLPEMFREPKTQGELAVKFGLGEDTLSNWKKRAGFWDLVKEKRRHWGKERTPNVIAGLYRKAVQGGNAAEAKLWLQYFEDWTERKEVDLGGKINIANILNNLETDDRHETAPKIMEDEPPLQDKEQK
ncbi:MAG: hypothetical protein ABSF55_03110 [Candidatus Staskawiczbacteria bacterium]|jgi:hypothetical protein